MVGRGGKRKQVIGRADVWFALVLGALSIVASACTFRSTGTTPPASDRRDGSADGAPQPGDATADHVATPDLAPALSSAGAACKVGDECRSGFCVDGVCCATACSGVCESCNEPEAAGVCQPVKGAPRLGRGPCLGNDATCRGVCDGSNGLRCAYPDSDVECAPARCSAGLAVARSVCSGSGVCLPGANVSCAPFTCDGAICAGGCGAGRPCQSGHHCSGGRCFPFRELGAVCESGDQCRSGHCVDGRCCVTSGCGICAACTGEAGTCQKIVSAPDPDSCADDQMCGAAGQCGKLNGQSCQAPGDCVSGFCVDGRCCNSACSGACQSCSQAGSIGTCKPTSLTSDVSNCGRCGNACSRNNISPTCAEGICGGRCAPGFTDCNADPGKDGCETDTASDPRNCGGCGVACRGTACLGGTCENIAFEWSAAGPIVGRTCVQILEVADPHTWGDNYLCTQRDFGFRWSSAGPLPGMVCTQWSEPSDLAGTWYDNFLCAPADFGLRWSSAGPIADMRCTLILEPSDPNTWNDNYLCAPL